MILDKVQLTKFRNFESVQFSPSPSLSIITGKNGSGNCHNAHSEIDLIKKLHKADLVDATFCAIEDSKELSIDSSLLTPTNLSLEILNTLYPKGVNK